MTTIYDIAQGLYYDLSDTIPLSLEKFSPFEFTVGEISLPVKFPFTKRNTKAMGLPNNINRLAHPTTSRDVLVSHGSFQRNGQLTISKAKEGAYIEGTIVFANSVFYRKAHNTAMEDIFNIERTDYITAAGWTEYFAKVMTGYSRDDFFVFEVLCNDVLTNKTYGKLNEVEHYALNPDRVVMGRLKHILQSVVEIEYDGEPLQVTLLSGHNITPFLKLSFVLTKLFEYFGYTLNQDALFETPLYHSLTVLNNTADTIVSGRLNYSMLVPTCSAAEFLKSVSVLLGCGFSFSGNIATTILSNDKYSSTPQGQISDFTKHLNSTPEVIYRNKQALVLNANLLSKDLSYRIPYSQNPNIYTYLDLGANFTDEQYIQFNSDDGIRYITLQQASDLARMRYALNNQFPWPSDYAHDGIDLSITDAIDSTNSSVWINYLDSDVKWHYQKITTLFGKTASNTLKIGNHAQEHSLSSQHIVLPDITENLLEGIIYNPLQDTEIFPKTFIGDIRRLNSKLSVEETDGGDKKECPIMFAYYRKGVVQQPAQDPGTYIYAVHFYGSSHSNGITYNPTTEANEYFEASINFAGWKGVYNRSYQQLARVLSKSPIEVKASLNLPLHELDYIESGNPVLIHGNLLLPKSLKYTLENNRARVTEAVFRTLRDYISEDEIDEQALNQQILNQ
jgi:hypothetical protein